MLVAVVVLMVYLQNDLSSKSDQIAQINQSIVNKTAALKNLQDLEQQQPIAAPLLAKMSSTIPGIDMLFVVQQNLQALAQSQNLAFNSSFGTETDATASTPGGVAIEMTLQGNYNAILGFLNSVENSGALISISSVDLTGQPAGGNFSAVITGNIPFHG